MRILDWYILRLHALPFAFGTSIVVFLFLMQFLMRYGEQLLGKGLEVSVILQLLGLNLPWMLVLAVPMGALFSTVYTFGSLAAEHEATVLKASGMSAWQMTRSVLGMALLLSAGLVWFNDRVLPEANHRAKVMLADIQRKRPTLMVEPGRFFTQLEGYTLLARFRDTTGRLLLDVTVYDKTQPGWLGVISADTASLRLSTGLTEFVLEFRLGEMHRLAQHGQEEQWIRFRRLFVRIPAQDYAFVRSDARLFARGEREMNITQMEVVVHEAQQRQRQSWQQLEQVLEAHWRELFAPEPRESTQPSSDRLRQRLLVARGSIESLMAEYVGAMQQERQYRVEIHKKYAIAAACFLFALAGAPLG
ncbi:MAG: LptF/LptG family permease, partial [Candidatus Kapabacteria bacterium]|nr:LptF/LptG family permease [Candidatus Kapabacteria bacterium]MDW7996323.1 LptF/LptG family permease [Bacteroidota bacterium]